MRRVDAGSRRGRGRDQVDQARALRLGLIQDVPLHGHVHRLPELGRRDIHTRRVSAGSIPRLERRPTPPVCAVRRPSSRARPAPRRCARPSSVADGELRRRVVQHGRRLDRCAPRRRSGPGAAFRRRSVVHHLRIREHLGHRVDRAGRHVRRPQQATPLGGGAACLSSCVQYFEQRRAVLECGPGWSRTADHRPGLVGRSRRTDAGPDRRCRSADRSAGRRCAPGRTARSSDSCCRAACPTTPAFRKLQLCGCSRLTAAFQQ